MKIGILLPVLCLLVAAFTPSPGQVREVPSVYPTIQSAIDSADDGDTVLVAPGVYPENINFLGKKIMVASWYAVSGDPAHIGTTIIDGSSPADPDTASVVLMVSGEDGSSVLEGFTLTGGTGTVWRDIHNNQLYREGGGILVELSSPTIRHNLITGNEAVNTTGMASAGGGGIRIGDGNPFLHNNIIMENRGHYGAGIVLNYTGATIRNNVVYRNSGGRDYGGSGIWAYGNGPAAKIVENNTVVDNISTTYGGGIYVGGTSMTVRNSIVWGNEAPSDPQISRSDASVSVTWSDIEGGWSGSTNLNVTPLFSDTSHYLSDLSPCIDAGDSGTAYWDPPDDPFFGPAEWPARGTKRNDMGAYGGRLARPAPYVDLHLDDPLPPSDFRAYSDYLTPGSVALTWNDPPARNNGKPLAGFRLRIQRDGFFIAEVDSGVETYTYYDTSLVLHEPYTFSIRTVVPADSSIPVAAMVYAGGHGSPAGATAFSVTDRSEGIELRWVNPSTQQDGTPLNDLAFIVLYRDGTAFDSLSQTPADTGSSRSYTDTSNGYHWYTVRARDTGAPPHYSLPADSVLGFGGLLTSYAEDFEGGAGSIFRSGPWDTTHVIGFHSGSSLTESPAGNYGDNQEIWFLTPRIVVSPGMKLTFSHIAIILAGDFGFAEITNDQGASYGVLRGFNAFAHPQWQDGSADSTDWFTEAFDLAAYAGDTVGFRFRFRSGASGNADGWYIDDIRVGITTDAGDTTGDGIPSGFRLEQNYPNPFNPTTTIRYFLPGRFPVRLTIHTITGERVATLVDEIQNPGEHRMVFDARSLPSGIYTCTITAGEWRSVRKMTLIR